MAHFFSSMHMIFPLTGGPPMHEASVAPRDRDRAPHTSHRATGHAAAHMYGYVCVMYCSVPSTVEGSNHSLNVLNPSGGRAHEPLHDRRTMRHEHWPSMLSSPEDRRSAASVRQSGGLASMASTTHGGGST